MKPASQHRVRRIAPRHLRSFRPLMESLEERVQPGDSLGLFLWGPGALHFQTAIASQEKTFGHDLARLALVTPSAQPVHAGTELGTVAVVAALREAGLAVPPAETARGVVDSRPDAADFFRDPLAGNGLGDPVTWANPFAAPAGVKQPSWGSRADLGGSTSLAGEAGGSSAQAVGSPGGGTSGFVTGVEPLTGNANQLADWLNMVVNTVTSLSAFDIPKTLAPKDTEAANSVTPPAPPNSSPLETPPLEFQLGVVWGGGGADSNWSTPANWIGGVVPTAADTVVFNTTSSKQVTLNIDVQVKTFLVNTGYHGTIDLNSHALRVSENLMEADGTVAYGTGTHSVGGMFKVDGGMANLQSATLTTNLVVQTAGSLDLGTGTLIDFGDLRREGGTLKADSARIWLPGSANQKLDFGEAATLGTVQVDKTGGVLTFQNSFTATTLAVSPGDTVKFLATKTFTVTNLSLPGTEAAPITLDGTELWTPWYLNVASTGSQIIRYVSVRQSYAVWGARINATDHVANAGFNENWDFGTAPTLTSATTTATNPNTLYLRYGEAMDPVTAADPANYRLSDGLIVTAAAISKDGKVVTLTASGNVAPGTTRVTVSNAIKSLVEEHLVTTTLTVMAGTSNGTRDVIQMQLATDDNHSVIQHDTRVELTLIAPGNIPVEIGVRQVFEVQGRSVVHMGETGTDTSATVTTQIDPKSGLNQAKIALRHAVTGIRENDFSLKAIVNNQEQGSKLATAIDVAINPRLAILKDGRPIVRSAIVSPTIAKLRLISDSIMTNHSPTTLAPGQYPLTDGTGRAEIPVKRLGMERNLWTSTYAAGSGIPQGAMPGMFAAQSDDQEKGTNKNDTRCGCKGQDVGGKSVDIADGEEKLDLQDLIIPGRGIDFEFQRYYESDDPRDTMGNKDFGANWRFSYADDFLVKDGTGSDDMANYVNYQMQSGYVFVRTDPGVWLSETGRFVQLRQNANTEDFEIRDKSGLVRVYHNFSDVSTPNANGRLKEIRDRNGNRMTFHYAPIDPDNTVAGDEKYVLAYVIDTMGREIRYQYYAATAQNHPSRPNFPLTLVTPNLGARGRLARVKDFKGDMNFDGVAESADFPNQFNNRTLVFDYDGVSNLVRASLPAVGGTPTGNNFASGRTFRYQYNANHQLTTIWNPNEVRDTPNTNPNPALAAESITYYSSGPNVGFVSSYTIGGTNGNNVPSGGTIFYYYTDFGDGSHQVEVTNRNGNQAVYGWSPDKTLVAHWELPRGFRSGEPALYEHTYDYNSDRLIQKETAPNGNSTEYTYNDTSLDRLQQDNLIRTIRRPGRLGGDQAKIETVSVYEPIYNQPSLVVSARGADMANNDFTPPIADPASRTMADPYVPGKRLNVRYAQVDYFDYQESREKAAEAPPERLDKDGSPGLVNQSPLIDIDGNVLTTEVWLVQILGLSEDADGLAELRNRLASNLSYPIRLGLGDLNGDNDPTPAVAGNIVRTVRSSPVLLTGSNQNQLETAIEARGDLINQTLGYDQGGTAEGAFGNQLQTIVTMRQHNAFGQLTKEISPEGNVTRTDYFAENDPDGDGHLTPPPADGRSLDATTGGYLRQTVVDTTRSYFDQGGTLSNGAFSNNNTNPAVTTITTSVIYDDVGNFVTMTNGRGIRTEFFVNELDQVVQVTRAANIDAVATADPSDPLYALPVNDPNRLTAFAYLSRSFFDYNGNLVLSQVEDRGNTSNVDGSGLGALPSQATDTTPGLSTADPVGGPAFADTLNLYDRINDRIETRREVSGTNSLRTRYRYDANQNLVLTIHPAGNADSALYDERDLLFLSTRGADARPTLPDGITPVGLYGPGDPITFDRPGGAGTVSSTTTRNYDLNGNLNEIVDAQDHGGARSQRAGAGDLTQLVYDGYDRPKTVTDPLLNKTFYTYDPDSNVVRIVREGHPADDRPGSQDNKTLAVTEYIHDELSRVVATHQVLFLTPYLTGQGPQRTPLLTDKPAMDSLAAYLADASTDTSAVPGRTDITVVGRVTTLTEYDRESRPTFTVQDDLDVYRTDYDGADRVVKTTDSAKQNGFDGAVFNPDNLIGNRVETAYDDNNNPIERKETDVTLVPGVVDEVFRETRLYDALDRLQIAVDNRGQTVDNRYDSRGNLVARADAVGPVNTRTINRRGLGSTAAVSVNDYGNVTRTRYDGLSRVLETETLLARNGQGNGTYLGATLQGALDAIPAGYLDPTNPAGDGLINTYYAWDANSQLLALRDDDGNTTSYIYDNQNRQLVERKGLFLGYQGTAFAIANGDNGTFNVATRGGVPPMPTKPPTDVTSAFDMDNNIVARVDEASNFFEYTFDALNRKKTCTVFPAKGFAGTTSQTWKYDGLSRLTQDTDNNNPAVTTDDVTGKHFYDSLSRQVEEQQQIGALAAKATSFNFDINLGKAVWQPSSLIYPDGRRVDSIYDALDRLVSRNDNGFANIATYQYIGKDRVAVLTYQNGTRLTYIGGNADVGYDNLRRVVNHRWELSDAALGSGTLVVGFGHQNANGNPAYDRANNKLIEEKLHNSGNSEVYTYDSAYRLKTFNRGTLDPTKTSIAAATTTAGALQAQTWNLEGLGNWSANTHTTGGVTATENRTHSNFNEIGTVTGTPYGGGVTGTHVLDLNGNLTDDGVRTYTWDAFDRLRQVFRKDPGGNVLVAEYTYDSQNRRMRKAVTNGGLPNDPSLNGTADFYYNGWQVVEERSPTLGDRVERQYVYGNYLDEIWTLDDRYDEATQQVIPVSALNDRGGNQRHFAHGNMLVSVYGLTDETGVLREGYQYDAYGRQTVFGPGLNGVVDFGGDDVITVGGRSVLGNPYMYTGQRFDAETGLDYYKNRYYSTDLGRFISRDPIGVAGGINLYAYVGNNPTEFVDPSGYKAPGHQTHTIFEKLTDSQVQEKYDALKGRLTKEQKALKRKLKEELKARQEARCRKNKDIPKPPKQSKPPKPGDPDFIGPVQQPPPASKSPGTSTEQENGESPVKPILIVPLPLPVPIPMPVPMPVPIPLPLPVPL